MDLPPYEINVSADADTSTVHLAGEIDYAASLDLKPKLQELTSQCRGNLLIDLNEVTFIDSEGIKALMAAFRWMHEKQGQAQIVRCSSCVQRVLKLTGLEFLLEASQPAGANACD